MILAAYLAGSASNLPLQLLQQKATSLPSCVVVTEALAGLPATGQVVLTGAAEAKPAMARRENRVFMEDVLVLGGMVTPRRHAPAVCLPERLL